MPLEIAENFEDLDQSWPLQGDFIQEGDDHVRTLKKVLKQVFPGVGGQGLNQPILTTEDELNFSQGVTSSIQTQLDALVASIALVVGLPVGAIIEYNGAFSGIPANFQLCDGTNGTPNLTDTFVFGTNTEIELNQTGGSNDAVVVSHGHTFTGAALAGHDHEAVGSVVNSGSDSGSALRYTRNGTTTTDSVSAGTPAGTVETSGASGTDANRPAFVKLAYIRRMT